MKDQYACDVNDFWKYAVLRSLTTGSSARLVVCWMLTPADRRRDGRQLAYLAQAERFRAVDPSLFATMGTLVANGARSVAEIENAQVLPRATFVSKTLPQNTLERDGYFASLLGQLRQRDLVFFDPDNGLEVASVPRGRREAPRYLYWDEFRTAIQRDCSVCVYQHFPREPHTPFALGLLRRMSDSAPDHKLFGVLTSRVAFLVAANLEHAGSMLGASRALVARSAGRVELVELSE